MRRADPAAEVALALNRWNELVDARERRCGTPERRFLRRAYARARNDALLGLALKAPPPARPPSAMDAITIHPASVA